MVTGVNCQDTLPVPQVTCVTLGAQLQVTMWHTCAIVWRYMYRLWWDNATFHLRLSTWSRVEFTPKVLLSQAVKLVLSINRTKSNYPSITIVDYFTPIYNICTDRCTGLLFVKQTLSHSMFRDGECSDGNSCLTQSYA